MERQLSLPWLLVATPQLTDPNFVKTVILVVEHNPHGSLGFVLNRPLPSELAQLIKVKGIQVPDGIPTWFGGPVESSSGIIVHRDETQSGSTLGRSTTLGGTMSGQGVLEREDRVLRGNVALSSSHASLMALIRYHQTLRKQPLHDASNVHHQFRFLVGYSGWGPGQLDAEMLGGAWIQAPATDELLFRTSSEDLWSESYAAVGVSPRSLVPSVQTLLN